MEKNYELQMSLAEQITARLTQTFSPLQLDVVNESHRHAGHSGDDGSAKVISR